MESYRCSSARCKEYALFWCRCTSDEIVYCERHFRRHQRRAGKHHKEDIMKSATAEEKGILDRGIQLTTDWLSTTKSSFLNSLHAEHQRTYSQIRKLLTEFNQKRRSTTEQLQALEAKADSVKKLLIRLRDKGFDSLQQESVLTTGNISDLGVFQYLRTHDIPVPLPTLLKSTSLSRNTGQNQEFLSFLTDVATTTEEIKQVFQYLYQIAESSRDKQTKQELFTTLQSWTKLSPQQRSTCFYKSAETLAALKNFGAAAGVYGQCAEVQRQHGLTQELCQTLFRQGEAQSNSGMSRAAIDTYTACAKLQRELRNYKALACTLEALGAQYESVLERSKSVAVYEELASLQRRLKLKLPLAWNLWKLARLFHQSNKRAMAIQNLEQCIALFKEHNKIYETAECSMMLAPLYQKEQKVAKAIATWKDSVNMWAKTENLSKQANALKKLGSAYISNEQSAEAKSVLTQSVQLFKCLGEKREAREVEGMIDQLYQRPNRRIEIAAPKIREESRTPRPRHVMMLTPNQENLNKYQLPSLRQLHGLKLHGTNDLRTLRRPSDTSIDIDALSMTGLVTTRARPLYR